MKKINLLLLLVLLTSCNNNSSSSNSSISSSSNYSSLTLSSSSIKKTEKEILEDFYSNLSSLEGNVQKMNMTVERTDYFATSNETEPLSISFKDISETIRYNSTEGQILVRKGKQAFKEDFGYIDYEEYEMQMFYDDNNFYRIIDYVESDDSFESVPFDENYIDDNLNIGFPLTEKQNINAMINSLDVTGYAIEHEGLEDYTKDGIWNYKYSFIIFEAGSTKLKSQQFTYNNKLTIKNGIIESVEQSYLVELYAGGLCLNWSESKSKFTFTQGERLNFDGNRFSIEDYKKISG